MPLLINASLLDIDSRCENVSCISALFSCLFTFIEFETPYMASASDTVGGESAEVGDNSQQASGLGGVLGSVGDKLSGLVGGTTDSNKGEGYVEKGKSSRCILNSLNWQC